MKSGLELLALFPVPRYLGKVARTERQLLSIYFSHDPLTLAMFHPVGGRRGGIQKVGEICTKISFRVAVKSENLLSRFFFFFLLPLQTIPTRRCLDANYDSDQNIVKIQFQFRKASIQFGLDLKFDQLSLIL